MFPVRDTLVTDEERDKIGLETLVYNQDSHDKLYSYVENMVGADCWKVSVGEETIFDSYIEDSFREAILDSIIRKEIYDGKGRVLFRKFINDEKDNYLDIYMFGVYKNGVDPGYKIHIEYAADNNTFTVSYYKNKDHTFV